MGAATDSKVIKWTSDWAMHLGLAQAASQDISFRVDGDCRLHLSFTYMTP
jgi:hypothetical protein